MAEQDLSLIDSFDDEAHSLYLSSVISTTNLPGLEKRGVVAIVTVADDIEPSFPSLKATIFNFHKSALK